MPTLAVYRQGAGRELNDLAAYVVASASPYSVQLAQTADATFDASEHRYDGAFVYAGFGGGQQRRVAPGGFTPNTGFFALELPWTVVPSVGDSVELTRLFPCLHGNEGVPPEDASYLTLANRALSLLWAPDRISVPFAGTSTASLTPWPWLNRPERLVRVLEPAPVAGFPEIPCDWRDPTLILDGTAPVLQLNRPYTGTLTLDVRRPGHTLISGVESTIGLRSDTETALPAESDVIDGMLMEAYRLLMHRSPGRPGGGDWAKKYADQREKFESLLYFDRTRLAQPSPQPVQGAA